MPRISGCSSLCRERCRSLPPPLSIRSSTKLAIKISEYSCQHQRTHNNTLLFFMKSPSGPTPAVCGGANRVADWVIPRPRGIQTGTRKLGPGARISRWGWTEVHPIGEDAAHGPRSRVIRLAQSATLLLQQARLTTGTHGSTPNADIPCARCQPAAASIAPRHACSRLFWLWIRSFSMMSQLSNVSSPL